MKIGNNICRTVSNNTRVNNVTFYNDDFLSSCDQHRKTGTKTSMRQAAKRFLEKVTGPHKPYYFAHIENRKWVFK